MITQTMTTVVMMIVISFTAGCASDNDNERYFRRSYSEDGQNRIPFDGRSECLPYENYEPPEDCPDE